MNEQADIAEPAKAGPTADELEAKRISRRAAIKKAAAVAGAVWVAPTIIDSLASPAAAVTAAKGTFSYQFSKAGNNSCGFNSPLTNGCNPTGFLTTAAGDIAIVSVACTTSSNNVTSATVTINAGYSCTFTNAAGTTSGTTCGVATIGGLGTKTLSLSGAGIGIWRLTITCPT